MDAVTGDTLSRLLMTAGERMDRPTRLYLVGGCALMLLGSHRATKDVDYDVDADRDASALLHASLARLAEELQLDVEYVPMAEFIPLPPGADERHRFHGRHGSLEVFIFDPYSIALSKIARGFEADIDDVVFLHRTGVLDLEVLRMLFDQVLPAANAADIDPTEFRRYFAETERRIRAGHL